MRCRENGPHDLPIWSQGDFATLLTRDLNKAQMDLKPNDQFSEIMIPFLWHPIEDMPTDLGMIKGIVIECIQIAI